MGNVCSKTFKEEDKCIIWNGKGVQGCRIRSRCCRVLSVKEGRVRVIRQAVDVVCLQNRISLLQKNLSGGQAIMLGCRVYCDSASP